MWILNYLPGPIIHLLLIIGISGIIMGFALSFVPIINKYKLPIQIISLILFSVALYLEGGVSYKKDSDLKIAELQLELEKAKAESGKINTEVITKYLTKKQIIKEKGNTIIEYIDREIKVFDNSCPLPDQVIKAHNAAAKNELKSDTVLTPSSEIDTKFHNDSAKPQMKLPRK